MSNQPKLGSKLYDCDRQGCSANAEYCVHLAKYEQYIFFSCGHDVTEMRKRLGIFAAAFKTTIEVTKIQDVKFKKGN